MNEWHQDAGIFSLRTPAGHTLIQIKHDRESNEYVVAQHGGKKLGRSWGEAIAAAEHIVNPRIKKEKR